MKRLEFTEKISAKAEKVYNVMLGLNDITHYEAWTAAFNPTSSYEGKWEKGHKMLFVGVDGEGKKGGMVSIILEVILNKYVSIKHIGMLTNGVEITTGPEVEAWAGSMENYSFEEDKGITTLTVELDTVEEFADYMNEKYPKALSILKQICEE
jgi:hypothetical protein